MFACHPMPAINRWHMHLSGAAAVHWMPCSRYNSYICWTPPACLGHLALFAGTCCRREGCSQNAVLRQCVTCKPLQGLVIDVDASKESMSRCTAEHVTCCASCTLACLACRQWNRELVSGRTRGISPIACAVAYCLSNNWP